MLFPPKSLDPKVEYKKEKDKGKVETMISYP